MATRGKLTEIEKAYIAGFFDGEGSISINKFRANNPNYKCPHYILTVTLTNTNLEIIEEIHEKLGASKQMRKREWGKSHWKTCYAWMASANKALIVLKLIRPYLKVKAKQADLAISFQESKMSNRKWVSSDKGKTLSPETLADREAIYKTMKNLNGSIRNRSRRD